MTARRPDRAVSRWVLTALAFLMLLPMTLARSQEATPTPPDSSIPPLAQVQGLIRDLNAEQQTFLVAQFLVHTDSATAYFDAEGNAAVFADFANGDRVLVLGTPQGPAETAAVPSTLVPILATEVRLIPDTATEPIIIEGTIDEIGPTIALYSGFIRVSDKEIFLTGDTRVIGPEGKPLTLTDLKVGEEVRVTAHRVPAISSTAPSATVLVASRIEVRSPVPTPEPTSTPEPTVTPTVTATVTPRPTTPPLRELDGTIHEIDTAGCFSMNDTRSPLTVLVNVCTTDETEITDANGNVLAFADLQLGDHVFVVAQVTSAEASLTAIKIVLRNQPQDPIVVEGEIEAIAPLDGPYYEGLLTVAGTRFLVSPETQIHEGNKPISFGDLAVGDTVRAIGLYQPTLSQEETPVIEQTLVAIEISRLPGTGTKPVELDGGIQEIDSANKCFAIVHPVGGAEALTTVCTTNTTQFKDADGNAIAFEDFVVGDKVHVVAEQDATTNELTALLVRKLAPPTPIVVEGRIQSIEPTELDAFLAVIRVSQTRFLVAADAEILDADGSVIPFADLRIGDDVRVEANRPGTPIAASATLPSPPALIAFRIQRLKAGGPAEMYGILSAIDTTTGCFDIAVAEGDSTRPVNICTNSATVIRTRGGDPLTFADLNVGDRVKVLVEDQIVTAQDDGIRHLIALEIVVLEVPLPVVVQGLIESIEPTSSSLALGVVTVRSVAFVVTSDTVLKDCDGNAIEFAKLAVGQLVRASGHRDATAATANSQVIADTICVLANSGMPVVEFYGIVDSVDAALSQFVVRGVLVKVVNDTKLLDRTGNEITFDRIQVGSKVHVRGVRNSADPSVIASLVRLLEDPNTDPGVEFLGRISEVNAEAHSFVAAGCEVLVTDTTELLGVDGEAIRFAALAVGQTVKVKGDRLETFAPTRFPLIGATFVQIISKGRLEFHAEGAIDAIEEDLWSVDGKRFRVTGETRFASSDGTELAAADFAVGDNVLVNGAGVAGEVPVANHVIRRDGSTTTPCNARRSFSGPVNAVDAQASTLLVGDITVFTSDETKILRDGEAGGVISLADVTTDDIARVSGNDGPSTRTMNACMIVVHAVPEPPPAQDHRVVGKISEIKADSMAFVVRDVIVMVDSDTKITSRNGGELTFGDLAVNQMVDAVGRLDADGVLVAAVVRVLEENQPPQPPVRPFSGLITSLSLPDSLTVGERNVTVNNETEFIGFDDAAIDPNVLVLGDAVLVVPVAVNATFTSSTTTVVAAKIKLRGAVLESIDPTTKQIVVAGGPVAVVNTTVIRDRRTGYITFGDLAVGDLVKVRLSDAAVYPPEAISIIRVEIPAISGDIGDFEPVVPGHDHGRPVITSTGGTNCFGFISLPTDMVIAEPDTLYDIRMHVSTNVSDPVRVPTARIRANMANYEKGASVVFHSAGTFSLVTNSEGREYSMLFMPPADLTTTSVTDSSFFASLDLLSFEDRFRADSSLILDSVQIIPIPASDIHVAATLAHDEFVAGSEGWIYGGAPEAFTAARHGADTGELSLACVDHNTFGFWTKNTGVVAEPGKVYRGRFLVSTNVDDPSEVPTFRVRLNTGDYQLSALVNVDAVATLSETLSTEARLYDVYMPVPQEITGDTSILASIDLLDFTSTADVDAAVNLEQFYLEELEIGD